jgi:hypothetical protein
MKGTFPSTPAAGNPDRMARESVVDSLDLTTSAGTTDEIDLRHAAGGMLDIPATAATTFTYLTSPKSTADGGTYRALVDKTNTAVTRSVTGNTSAPLPDECFGARYVKIVSDVAVTVGFTAKG